jgi:hypothetical protein
VTAAPKLSLDAVLAAALVAVIVPGLGAWLGAHTGTRGTVIGTAIGAVLSVLCGWLVLRLSYHTRSGLARVPWRKAKPWHYAVAALAVFVVAMAAVTGVEAGVLHKSLSASVSGSAGSGTTVGTVVANHPVRPPTDGHGTAQGHPSASASTAMPSGTVTVSPVPSGSPSVYPEPQPTTVPASPVAPATVPPPAPAQSSEPAATTGAQQ